MVENKILKKTFKSNTLPPIALLIQSDNVHGECALKAGSPVSQVLPVSFSHRLTGGGTRGMARGEKHKVVGMALEWGKA